MIMSENLFAYSVSERNKHIYEKLCLELLKTSSVFKYKHPNLRCSDFVSDKQEYYSKESNNDIIFKKSPKKRKLMSSGSVHPEQDTNNTNEADIKCLQKNLISSLNNSSNIDINKFKFIEPYQVCLSDASKSLVITDELVIQVCKKSEKLDDNTAPLVGTLLVLPKILHLSSKLTPATVDAISEYVRCHPKIATTSTLVPFLKYCASTQEQHRDLLIQLIELLTSSAQSELLSALASKDCVNNVDLQIFHHLCQKVDPEASSTHTAVLSFLGTALKSYSSSVKLGQCLLFIVKQMGHHMRDSSVLWSLTDIHSSGMKKAIEIQLKKITKNVHG